MPNTCSSMHHHSPPCCLEDGGNTSGCVGGGDNASAKIKGISVLATRFINILDSFYRTSALLLFKILLAKIGRLDGNKSMILVICVNYRYDEVTHIHILCSN